MAGSREAAFVPSIAAGDAGDILDSPDAARIVIRGSALRSIVYLLAVLANVLALPFLFRHLGVQDSGRYVTVLTVTTLVGAIVETGFGAISVREYARRGPDTRPELMSDLIAVRGAALLLSGFVALAFLAATGYPAIIVVGAAIGILGVFFEALSSTYSVSLTSSLRLGWMASLQILRQTVAVVLTLALIVLDAPLVYFFAILVAAGAAQAGGALYATRGTIPHRPSLEWRRSTTLMRTSAAFIAAMALTVIYFRAPMILMPVLSTETETGYLGIPFRLLEIVTLISVLVLSSAFPIIARAAGSDQARHHYALLRMSEVSLIIGLYVALVAFVGSPLIVALLGGPDFEPASALLRILAVSLAAKFVIAAWAFSLLSLDRNVAVLRANVLATVFAIVLTLALVPVLDATGGALAIVISDVALMLGYAWALHRSPDPVDLPWARFGALIGISAVAATVCLLPVPVPGQLVIATVVYGIVLWRGGLIPTEISHVLPGRGRG